ncbi:MAG TPA: hypothetical protein VN695_11760 [Streptosporangiaceae bacterium]|nr:hypothetical protein [Streptosporangiaceae bacterium]
MQALASSLDEGRDKSKIEPPTMAKAATTAAMAASQRRSASRLGQPRGKARWLPEAFKVGGGAVAGLCQAAASRVDSGRACGGRRESGSPDQSSGAWWPRVPLSLASRRAGRPRALPPSPGLST